MGNLDVIDRNAVGNLGELTAGLRLGMFTIFRSHIFGDKTPVFDMLLEIIDKSKPYQAIVQVKATYDADPYDKKGNLITPIPVEKLQKLISLPLPTYAAGVDVNNEIMHLAPAFDRDVKMSTIPPILVLSHADQEKTKENLLKLKADIINYWEGYNMHVNKPAYKSIL